MSEQTQPPVSEHSKHSEHSDEVNISDLPNVPTPVIIGLGVVAAAISLVLFVIGLMAHHRQEAALDDRQHAADTQFPIVQISKPTRKNESIPLILPGNARAWQQTDIYPRANGYLQEFVNHVDIGDHVEAGQKLAIISSPEVDAQLGQAEATRAQAIANQVKAKADDDLAELTLGRYENLLKTGGVTKQDRDEKASAADQTRAALAASDAAIKAAQADVERLSALKNFEVVIAPFAGTITRRNYDVGALLSPTNTSADNQIFRIEDDSTLRVFVDVPQEYATQIHDKTPAVFMVRNYPDQQFPSNLIRVTGAVDPASRTMPMEVDIPNTVKDKPLKPGMYGQIRFDLRQESSPLMIASGEMLFNSNGTQVAVVREVDGKPRIHYQNIVVGRDMGTTLEVRSGLSEGEMVVANPGQRLVENQQVEIAKSDKAALAEADNAVAQKPK